MQRGAIAGIFLDLRLPDGWGLDFLEALSHAGRRIPTIVVSAYGTPDDVVVALQRGAKDFRCKPLFETELLHAVALLFSERQGPHPSPDSETRVLARAVAACAAVDNLAHPDLLRIVGELLINPRISLRAFAEVARAFVQVAAVRRRPIAVPPPDATRASLEAALDSCRLPMDVQSTLANIDVAIARDGAAYGRCGEVDRTRQADHRLVAVTGMGWRDWRRTALVRRAVQHLTVSHELVSQVGYTLGYRHPAQLDRDFHRVLGMTPREFRRLHADSRRDGVVDVCAPLDRGGRAC